MIPLPFFDNNSSFRDLWLICEGWIDQYFAGSKSSCLL